MAILNDAMLFTLYACFYVYASANKTFSLSPSKIYPSNKTHPVKTLSPRFLSNNTRQWNFGSPHGNPSEIPLYTSWCM